MKNLFRLSVFIVAFMATSCATIKLTGTYPESQRTEEVECSFDEAWAKTIEYFTMNNIPISNLDKNSGMIIASKVSLQNHYTREKKGVPMDTDAYVVIPTVRGGYGNVLEPNAAITGHWTMLGDFIVRLNKGSERVIVTINILNLECYYEAGIIGRSTTKVPIKSTGKFEEGLFDYIIGK